MNASSKVKSNLIASLKRLKVHDHLCLIYETKDEQFASAIPFIRTGLERGEKCIYIADENTSDQILETMQSAGKDIDSYLKSGALAVMTKKVAYLKEGFFDPDLMIDFLKESVRAAKAAGFSALRVTGEMTWVLGDDPGTERLIEYEAKLNRFFPEYDCLAICQYNRHRFPVEIIRDVINTHPIVIYGGMVCKNFYYVPPDEFLGKGQEEKEIERLLRNIRERKASEIELIKAEKRYRTLFETSADGILIADLKNRKFKYANPAICKLLGHTEKELKRMCVDDIHPKEKLEYIISEFEAQSRREKTLTLDIPCIKKDGSIIYVDISATSSNIDGHLCNIGFFRDITDRKNAEAALIESEKKFRELVENINDALYTVNDKRVITYISPVIESIIGYSPEEIVGRPFTDFIYDDDIPLMTKCFEEKKAGDTTPTECRLLTKSNEIRCIRASSKPIRKGNRIIGVYGCISDITKQKSAEESLQESENRYRHLIQNIPLGLYRNTPGPKGKFIMANQALIRMHGFEKIEDFLQTPVANLYWEPKKRKAFSEKLIAQGEVFREELLLKKRDGTPFWGAVSATVISDESGKIKYFDGIIEDITKQKEAEEALQISEERFRNIAEETDDWIWEIGKDLDFKYSNSRIKEILGYEPEEVIGKSFLDFMSEKELYRLESKKDYLLREIIFAGQETYLLRKDGKTIITESSGVPIFRRNRAFIGFQGLTRDITERVLAKEEEERRRQQLIQADKMISLGILVSGVAHEINNPNQFIMVNAPMLKRAWENITPILDKYYKENGDFTLAGLPYTEMRERIPELFSKIREGSQRIKHIVRNLKDYAREGGPEITQEVDINAVLQSALTILSNLLKKSTKKLKVVYADNLPTIRGNFQRIEQVLINLIQNACQALPDPMKGIMITTSYNKKTRKVVVKIKDEGVGIAEDQKKYILDPFFTSRRDAGGTGLGLSISAGIIKEHGGRLEFSSEPGRGTTVSVILPVSREQKS